MVKDSVESLKIRKLGAERFVGISQSEEVGCWKILLNIQDKEAAGCWKILLISQDKEAGCWKIRWNLSRWGCMLKGPIEELNLSRCGS
jgi:hypothetical protein